jgi:hypothetical protein
MDTVLFVDGTTGTLTGHTVPSWQCELTGRTDYMGRVRPVNVATYWQTQSSGPRPIKLRFVQVPTHALGTAEWEDLRPI